MGTYGNYLRLDGGMLQEEPSRLPQMQEQENVPGKMDGNVSLRGL